MHPELHFLRHPVGSAGSGARTRQSILDEVEQLAGPERALREVVLVAQDLALHSVSIGVAANDVATTGQLTASSRPIVELITAVAQQDPGPACSTLPVHLDDALMMPSWPPVSRSSTSRCSTFPGR